MVRLRSSPQTQSHVKNHHTVLSPPYIRHLLRQHQQRIFVCRFGEIIHCVVLQKPYHRGMQNINIRVQTCKSTKRYKHSNWSYVSGIIQRRVYVFISERRNTGPEVYYSRRLYSAWTQLLKGQRSWILWRRNRGRAMGCRFPQWLVIHPAFTLEREKKKNWRT